MEDRGEHGRGEAETRDRIGRRLGEAAREHRVDRPRESRDEAAANPGR